jgi:hypothetical protein
MRVQRQEEGDYMNDVTLFSFTPFKRVRRERDY